MLRWVVRVLAWTVACGALSALALAVLLPRLAGATPYTILTGSMRPAMPPGTLVVVRPVDPADIAVGDVITYQLRSGDPTVVTHRVVAMGFDGDSKELFQTRGDANPVPDEQWVKPVQVRGKRWYYVPYLGYAGALMDGHQKQVGTWVVGGLLISYSLVTGVGAVRDCRRRRPAGAHLAQEPEKTHV